MASRVFMDNRSTLLGSLNQIRRRVGLNRSVLPAAVNRRIDRRRLSERIEDGLPEGLDEALLTAIVQEERRLGFVEVRHAPLQEWKLTSASLVWMRLEGGTTWTLVFKDVRLGDDDYPAIGGLSVEPGVPEYALYSRMTSSLRLFTPRIFSVIELEDRRHYQYLMEDLRSRYHPVYRRREKASMLGAIAGVHEALLDWVTENGSDSLIEYDAAYVADLIAHAEAGLDNVARMGGRAIAEQAAAIWPDVVDYLLAEENLARRRLRPIHGDLNPKNCFVSNSDRDHVRIVDWEWSGYGTVHDEVASLTKARDPQLDERAFRVIRQLDPELDERDHLELFWWSQLATAVRDAALLSHQLAGLDDPPEVVAARAFGLWHSLPLKYMELEEALASGRSNGSLP